MKIRKLTSVILIVCILSIFTGCGFLPWSEEYRQKKVWPGESAEYLKDRYPGDTFTYKDYYETLPLTTSVYRYGSANYPEFDIEVSFCPNGYYGNSIDVEDNYQWIRYGEDLIAETEQIMADVFPGENYGICMQGYFRMEGPVYATLDEFLDATCPTVVVLLYTDPSKEYEEDYKNVIGHKILNTGHDFDIMFYPESDETNPSGMTREEILNYVDQLSAYSGYLCEIHHLQP